MTRSVVTTPRPLRRDAVENRRRLLEAAAKVFAEHGPDAGVEEIARVAGVGMGTLYRRFPTKEALVGELVNDLLGRLAADAREALRRGDGNGLEEFLYRAASDQVLQRGCLARLWNSDSAADLLDEVRGLIVELLRDAQRHGTVRDDVSASDISVVFWALRGVIETTSSSAPHAWRRHLALVLAGLRPNATPLPDTALSKAQLDLIIG